MLGIRRTLDGLVIKPCLPSAWDQASARRVHRGTTYDIHLANPGRKAGAAVRSMSLDGVAHDPARPLPVDGGRHCIEVVMAC
jgi:cellobiose phosphorylase